MLPYETLRAIFILLIKDAVITVCKIFLQRGETNMESPALAVKFE